MTLDSVWMPALRLAASDPLPNIVERLNAFQPSMLVMYASMIRILADEQIAGRLRIKPHLIFASSEVLTDESRRRATAAWGREPFSQYAATETGGLAAERESHDGMYIFEDNVILENVDAENRPVPAGVLGHKVLVTTLFSRTLPLIRYGLNDRVRISPEAVRPGFPFAKIEGIGGRTEDALHFTNSAGEDTMVQPLVFHDVLDTLPVRGWQVRQTTTGLDVLIADLQDESALANIQKTIGAVLAGLGVTVTINVVVVRDIPNDASGKRPLIKSLS
jgi:phenylacetate-CoA ligase